MVKLFFILLGFIIINETYASSGIKKPFNCTLNCRFDRTDRCGALSYYMDKCSRCNNNSAQCSKAFCHNHPNLCEKGFPLKKLSVDTNEMTDNGLFLDVCAAKLFIPLEFDKMTNNDLDIRSLNLLDITSFSQTGGDALKRNLGIIRKLAANYLTYKNSLIGKQITNLKLLVDQWFISTFQKDPDLPNHFSNLDFHTIAEYLRREIYLLKGIETQLKIVVHEGKKYPMTVSKLGCIGESEATLTTPIHNRNKAH